MSDGLATRLRHRLRFVESYHDRRLFVECIEFIEGRGGVPQIPHPDGLAPTTGSHGWTPEAVITWLADRDIKLVPWQITKMERL
jgi:hypothetical protein